MNLLNYIGNTPLVKLNSFADEDIADIYVKLEYFNPGGSIKTRVAHKMIQIAEEKGLLNRDTILLEPTGGNTGLGLALISILKGYKFIAVVPDNYSIERINLLKLYNAEVILSNSKEGNSSHIDLANKLLKSNSNYLCLDQFHNTACIKAHYEGTGTEICNNITPDAFVCCVGSSGTFSGVGKKLKEINPNVKLYVSQPEGCDILKGTAIPHKVQGVSLGIIPPLLDYNLITDTVDVSFDRIKQVLNTILSQDGLFLGNSAGANIAAAIEVAKKLGKSKVVCTVAPDSGQYYINDTYSERINNNA